MDKNDFLFSNEEKDTENTFADENNSFSTESEYIEPQNEVDAHSDDYADDLKSAPKAEKSAKSAVNKKTSGNGTLSAAQLAAKKRKRRKKIFKTAKKIFKGSKKALGVLGSIII